jgi:hypothetical protein
MVPFLAHCVNSVSILASDFGHGLALDFGLDHMQLEKVTTKLLYWKASIN